MKSNLFKLVLLFASVAAVSACGPKAPKGGYIIKGSVEGIPDNAVVQLIPVAHEVMDPLAEATVTDGKFTFTGIVEQPTAVSLIVKDAYGYRNLMALRNGFDFQCQSAQACRDNRCCRRGKGKGRYQEGRGTYEQQGRKSDAGRRA